MSASILTDQFSDLLGRLPASLNLDDLAHKTKAIQRERQLKGGADLLRLALARGPGGLSLRETAAWASMTGLAELSNPGVKYRLDQATGFLEATVQALLGAKLAGPIPLWPGRRICLSDGTCVSKPGSTGTDWRVHGVFELGRGGFSHLEVTDKHGAESLCRGAAAKGEVRIGDRFFARAPSLQKFRAEQPDADFIVRVRWNAFRLITPEGKKFDLIKHLIGLGDAEGPHEVHVQALLGRAKPPLALRLIIQRKPPEAARATCASLKCQASRKQQELDARSLVAAEFMILATSLPTDAYPAAEAMAAYRLRWQIELAFKRLKSLLHMDKLPTTTERGSRSWLNAHLILALICDDISQEVLDSSP